MMAFMHLLMVTGGIPLTEIINLVSEITNRYLFIEYV